MDTLCDIIDKYKLNGNNSMSIMCTLQVLLVIMLPSRGKPLYDIFNLVLSPILLYVRYTLILTCMLQLYRDNSLNNLWQKCIMVLVFMLLLLLTKSKRFIQSILSLSNYIAVLVMEISGVR